eukprot:9770731-Alexandrium_andersonii.AAC.1
MGLSTPSTKAESSDWPGVYEQQNACAPSVPHPFAFSEHQTPPWSPDSWGGESRTLGAAGGRLPSGELAPIFAVEDFGNPRHPNAAISRW